MQSTSNCCSRDSRECKEGLLCRSNRKCVTSAEGQRCSSDFWCPTGFLCSRKSRQCTSDLVPEKDRFPPTPRSKPCSSTLDCDYSVRCLNGVCLPRSMDFVCKDDLFNRAEPRMRCFAGVQVVGAEGQPWESKYPCFLWLTCRDGLCLPSRNEDTVMSLYMTHSVFERILGSYIGAGLIKPGLTEKPLRSGHFGRLFSSKAGSCTESSSIYLGLIERHHCRCSGNPSCPPFSTYGKHSLCTSPGHDEE